MENEITEKQFKELFQPKLGEHYERAIATFKNYGRLLSYDVTNVLLHALDKDKVEEVLDTLEKHYRDHLRRQHPELRGRVEDRLLGINKTVTMFSELFRNVLDSQIA